MITGFASYDILSNGIHEAGADFSYEIYIGGTSTIITNKTTNSTYKSGGDEAKFSIEGDEVEFGGESVRDVLQKM